MATVIYTLGIIVGLVLIVWALICASSYSQQRKDYKEYGGDAESYEEFCERFYSHYLK